MGLQDRDYMKEHYKKQRSQSEVDWTSYTSPKKTIEHPLKRFVRNLFPSLFLLAFLVFLFNALPKMPTPKTTSFIKMPERQPELINGGMIMTADAQGHFRGVFLVNHIPMSFMIDTGATATVIPADKALAVGLTFGRSGYSDTAGGKALVQATHIDSLRIGTAELKNIDAFINPYINEGLIGMNTLKFFRITYAKNTLTMVLSDEPTEIAEIQKTLTSALK